MNNEIIIHVRYRFCDGDDNSGTYSFDFDEFVLLEEKYANYLHPSEELNYGNGYENGHKMTWIVIKIFRENNNIDTLKKLGAAKALVDTELDFSLKTMYDMNEPKRIEEYNNKLKIQLFVSFDLNIDVVLFTINDLNNIVYEYCKEKYTPRIETSKLKYL